MVQTDVFSKIKKRKNKKKKEKQKNSKTKNKILKNKKTRIINLFITITVLPILIKNQKIRFKLNGITNYSFNVPVWTIIPPNLK